MEEHILHQNQTHNPIQTLAQSTPADEKPMTGFRKWLPLVMLSLALMIIILDTTILSVSLKTIIHDLHTTIQNIQWVITAYSLMLAAFTVTGGRLGDLFGRKKMFMIGAVIFAVGSFMTSISTSVGFMIAGEAIVEGIGAALMVPATSSLLVSNYRGRDRQIAFGIWGGIAAGAAALGPVVGGWLTTYASWRWAFRINVVVAVLLILGSVFIKEVIDTKEKRSIDYTGIVLSAIGLFLVVYGFIEASTYGWIHASQPFSLFGNVIDLWGLSFVPFCIALGIITLGFFAVGEYIVEKDGGTPLVSLKLFQNGQFTVAAVITTFLALGQTGLSFVLPIFMQGVKNLDAFHTGIAMLPMSLTLLVAAPASAYISKYISPKRIIQIGLIFDGLGFLVLSQSIRVAGSIWELAPGFALFGIGLGFMMSQTSNMALSAVSVEQAGEASGVNTTLRQVGSTLGSAVLGAIMLSLLLTNVLNGISSSHVIPNSAKSTISTAVSGQMSNIELGSGSTAVGSSVPVAIQTEITTITNQATVDASKNTLLYGIIFVLISLVLSLKLPGGKNIERGESLASVH